MVLCGMSPEEIEILRVVRLAELWPICETRADAFKRRIETCQESVEVP